MNPDTTKELACGIEDPCVLADSTWENTCGESQYRKDLFFYLETHSPSTKEETNLKPSSFPNSSLFPNPSQA